MIDAYVVMPNHLHGILVIEDPGSTAAESSPSLAPIGVIVGSFKSASTRWINRARDTPGVTVWQRNYYEPVVRDRSSLERFRDYIVSNPASWTNDPERPFSS